MNPSQIAVFPTRPPCFGSIRLSSVVDSPLSDELIRQIERANSLYPRMTPATALRQARTRDLQVTKQAPLPIIYF